MENEEMMLFNYLKTAIRYITKHKTYSIINMLGLVTGITAFFLILSYVSFEFSYDSFNNNVENIYRLQTNKSNQESGKGRLATSAPALGPVLQQEFPEVIDYSRIFKMIRTVVSYKNKSFRDDNILYADPSFLTIFTFPLRNGDAARALSEPNAIVITPRTARKYFGDSDPIGKVMTFSNRYDTHICRVAGVLKKVPDNSHIKFDILVSMKTPSNRLSANQQINIDSYWGTDLFYTYIQLRADANYRQVEEKMQTLIDRYDPFEEVSALRLQPLENLYLTSDLLFDLEIGNRDAVVLLIYFALIILLIAWVNYINLSTAKSMERAKEAGMRKVLGAKNISLIKQFILESALVNFVAIILAYVLTELTIPFFSELVGKNLSLSFFTLQHGILLALLFIVGIFLSSWYPAFVLASLKPITVLRGKSGIKHSPGFSYVRKGLIVFQFAASLILIICTLAIFKQIEYMRQKDLGMDIDQMLVLRSPIPSDPAKYDLNIQKFKNEAMNIPAVNHVAGSYYIPGSDIRWRIDFKKIRGNAAGGVGCGFVNVDEDYLETYQFELISGRNFSSKIATDADAVILNAAAINQIGFQEPEQAVGQMIEATFGQKLKIIGVIKDYHHTSLKNNYEPVVMFFKPGALNYYSLKIDSHDLKQTISRVQNLWAEIFPGSPFEYFFMDDFFNEQYKADQYFGKTAMLFALVSIIVAGLGLFGLSSYNLLQRKKEIGIRKVLGAGVGRVLYQLSKDHFKLIFIATIVAIPVAYFISRSWLTNYAFQAQFGWQLFLIPVCLVILIAFLTLCFQTIRAATANPVESLRYE